MSYFWIHCPDCGEHTEIRSRDTQEACGCSSIDWKSCDAMEPGACEECDEINGHHDSEEK